MIPKEFGEVLMRPTNSAKIRLRVRPILMTSITTIIGLSPLVFGWGEGLEMLRPLAITVVGGLSGSMVLTLFVIPCVYTIFHKTKIIT